MSNRNTPQPSLGKQIGEAATTVKSVVIGAGELVVSGVCAANKLFWSTWRALNQPTPTNTASADKPPVSTNGNNARNTGSTRPRTVSPTLSSSTTTFQQRASSTNKNPASHSAHK